MPWVPPPCPPLPAVACRQLACRLAVFLASDGTAKLGDLNVSKLTKGDDLMQTKIGTPYYMAPEVRTMDR